MFADYPPEQVTAAIDDVAEQLLWEANLAIPPVDAFELARRLGALVAADGSAGQRARHVEVASGCGEPRTVILLAPEERAERRQWAVAHELGESYAHRVFGDLGANLHDSELGAREWIANRLACAILLPRAWFVDAMIETDADLFALKKRFEFASHELIARRWLETIDGPVSVTLFDQGKLGWRRTNFGVRRPPLSRDELEVWRPAHEGERATLREPTCHTDSSLFSRIRCWPVHEPGWRREILLTEIADEW